MYLPEKIINMQNTQLPQIRLGLCGESACGKTHSSLTFPNPIIIDADNGLTAYAGQDIKVIPLYNPQWVTEYGFPRKDKTKQPNRKDALLKWLNEEGIKLEKDQTLILDSMTAIEEFFGDAWTPRYTKNNQIDEFAFWEELIEFFKEIHILIKSFNCHVIITYHEMKQRDKITGALLEKIQPLMQGKYVTRVKTNYTDFFRCITVKSKDKPGHVDYFWQVKSNEYFDCKTRLKFPDDVQYVKPSFEIFKQYENKLINSSESSNKFLEQITSSRTNLPI